MNLITIKTCLGSKRLHLGVKSLSLSITFCKNQLVGIFTNMNTITNIINYFQKKRGLKHLLFWIAVLLLHIPRQLVLRDNADFVTILVMHGCILVSQVLAAYFYAYFVIPKFLIKKKYIQVILLFLIGTYVFSALERIMVVHVGEALVRKPPFTQEPILEILTDWKKLLKHYVPSMYSVVLIFLFVKYFLDYKKVKERDLLLSKEKTANELKALKAQLNPHFLFNTLNNIYTLSLANSPKTPSSIGKLSEILDHVLYKCNQKFVLLSNEIKLLENYIELEKLRYDERLQVKFQATIDNDREIPPLILLSLVENAFKHGAGEDSGAPKIWIEIKNNQEAFEFCITNTIAEGYRLKKESIGLSNIRKQLNLIYKTDYDLQIQVGEKKFKVVLKINQKV
ncbi:Histidine kinase [Tenacibaculum sp. 190524A02b]